MKTQKTRKIVGFMKDYAANIIWTTILVLLLIGLAISSCAPADPAYTGRSDAGATAMDTNVYRVVDRDFNIVCYYLLRGDAQLVCFETGK